MELDAEQAVKFDEMMDRMRRQGPGKRLRMLREFQRHTQAETAKQIGCSRAEVGAIEAGKTPSPTNQAKIRELYGVTWS